jgi:FixJ family two-component response regulator
MASTVDHGEERGLDVARVHVVDDDANVLSVISKLVESAGLEAVPHLDPKEFLSHLRPDEYACAILDLVMPGLPGLEVLHELSENHPTIPVIMLSGHGDVATALESVREGAVDFIEKPVRREQLLEGIRGALEIARQQRASVARDQEIQRRIETLTPREAQLMPLLCKGISVKKIAFEFGLSFKTVQVHRSAILRKTMVSTVVELTNLMHERRTLAS